MAPTPSRKDHPILRLTTPAERKALAAVRDAFEGSVILVCRERGAAPRQATKRRRRGV